MRGRKDEHTVGKGPHWQVHLMYQVAADTTAI